MGPSTTRSYYRRGFRPELKVLDNRFAGNFNQGGGTGIYCTNLLGQGTDFTNRIGRKIITKSILLRVAIYPNLANPTSDGDIVRVMLLYDTQSNGALPTYTTILASPTAAYIQPINLNNRDRFRVLSDSHYAVEAFDAASSALTTGAPKPRLLRLYKKVNLETIYSGTNNTIADISSGSILLFFISQKPGCYQYESVVRIRFADP